MKVLLVLALVLVGFGSWIYGFYCFIQTHRHRIQGLPHYGMILTADQLSPTGRIYNRRHWSAWGIGLGVSLIAHRLLTGHW